MKFTYFGIIAKMHACIGWGGKALLAYKDSKGNKRFQTRFFKPPPNMRKFI